MSNCQISNFRIQFSYSIFLFSDLKKQNMIFLFIDWSNNLYSATMLFVWNVKVKCVYYYVQQYIYTRRSYIVRIRNMCVRSDHSLTISAVPSAHAQHPTLVRNVLGESVRIRTVRFINLAMSGITYNRDSLCQPYRSLCSKCRNSFAHTVRASSCSLVYKFLSPNTPEKYHMPAIREALGLF